MFPRIPREIVDLIIDNLHDDIQALLQLSLVSLVVSDSSRRHLLHSLTIKLGELELFLLECDTGSGSGSGHGSASGPKATQNKCATIATFRERTKKFQLICTAGVGTKGCWNLCLQAVGRIPFALPNMKSLALVDFPFHRLHTPLSHPGTQLTDLSSLQTALGFRVGCEEDVGDETMKAFHAVESLVVKSTTGFIHYEPLHILLAYFFPNVRKLVCQESDEQCSVLVPCGTPPTLPNDTISLPQLRNLELLNPSKDIYTMLLHGPHYLRNIQNLELDDGPCFAGGFKSYDILREVGQQLKSLRLNLDAAAKDIGFQPHLWNLSHNPNLTTLILHTRYDRYPRRKYPVKAAAWMIDLLNVIDISQLRNLALLVEEVPGQIAPSNVDTGLLGALCELGQCKNHSLFEGLKEFWLMYKPADESQLVIEENILGLFGLGKKTAEKEVVMPRVEVVKGVDGILGSFNLDSE